MKNCLFILFAFFVLDVCAENSFSDTTRIKKQKYNIFLWMKQPTSIFVIHGMDGTFETNEKGFYFFPRTEPVKHPFAITYYYLFKDIEIPWKDIAKIKRRGVNFITFFMRDVLFIKKKDGKRYHFLFTRNKTMKAIIKTYKTHMGGYL